MIKTVSLFLYFGRASVFEKIRLVPHLIFLTTCRAIRSKSSLAISACGPVCRQGGLSTAIPHAISSTKRTLPIYKLISLVFISSLLMMVSSCKNDLKKIKLSIDKSILNTERADSVTIIYSKEGMTKAQLFAKTFNHVQDAKPPYIEMKNGLRVLFFNDSLVTQSTLTAKYGKYYEQNGNVLVRDSVVVNNLKKEQLNTEELVWNEKLQKFYTNKFVKITTPTQVIYGDGLESNQNFSDYTILNVKGIIGVNKSTLPSQ